ncbi:MAG: hypothetical protein GC208_08715 [Alphaproteobacteria bacterium]|nr:hypothetical protein [Alphaproteobacteria bacterium]
MKRLALAMIVLAFFGILIGMVASVGSYFLDGPIWASQLGIALAVIAPVIALGIAIAVLITNASRQTRTGVEAETP